MNTKQNFSTLELTKMALLTALICVSAYIVIPLPFSPASLTAQTLVVNLIALLLTPRQAAFTIVVYMLLGLSGLPVFSGGVGGPGKLFWPYRRVHYGLADSRCTDVLAEGKTLQLQALLSCDHAGGDACDFDTWKHLYEVCNRHGLGIRVYGCRTPIYPSGPV